MTVRGQRVSSRGAVDILGLGDWKIIGGARNIDKHIPVWWSFMRVAIINLLTVIYLAREG